MAGLQVAIQCSVETPAGQWWTPPCRRWDGLTSKPPSLPPEKGICHLRILMLCLWVVPLNSFSTTLFVFSLHCIPGCPGGIIGSASSGQVCAERFLRVNIARSRLKISKAASHNGPSLARAREVPSAGHWSLHFSAVGLRCHSGGV